MHYNNQPRFFTPTGLSLTCGAHAWGPTLQWAQATCNRYANSQPFSLSREDASGCVLEVSGSFRILRLSLSQKKSLILGLARLARSLAPPAHWQTLHNSQHHRPKKGRHHNALPPSSLLPSFTRRANTYVLHSRVIIKRYVEKLTYETIIK
jgi:hypothetical protein